MKRLIVILNILIFGQIMAQNRVTNVEHHGWYMYFGNFYLTSKLGIHTEYQWRRHNWIQNWQQSLGRIGLFYQIDTNASVTAGYGNIISFPYGAQPIAKETTEHRIWEQLLLNQKVHAVAIKHRFRLEQRWIENSKDKFDIYQRFRYQFAAEIPFIHYGRAKNPIFFSFYDEIFLNFGKNIRYNVFDQNRLYFAIGAMLTKDLGIRVGYLNQLILKSDGFHQESNHTLQIGLHSNFHFHKTSSN